MVFVSVRLAIALASGIMGSCAEQEYANYTAVSNSAYRQIPAFRSYLGIFPSAEHYVTRYRTERYPEEEVFYLTAVAGLYNRYQVTMFIPLRLNTQKTKIVDFKQPRFVMCEVIEVAQDYTTYGVSRTFGVEDWDEAAMTGNLSTLIPGEVKNQPVPGFERVYSKPPPKRGVEKVVPGTVGRVGSGKETMKAGSPGGGPDLSGEKAGKRGRESFYVSA